MAVRLPVEVDGVKGPGSPITRDSKEIYMLLDNSLFANLLFLKIMLDASTSNNARWRALRSHGGCASYMPGISIEL